MSREHDFAEFAAARMRPCTALPGCCAATPIVPTAVAGAALTAFSGGLLGLYLRTPGMRKPGSLAPTEQGMPIAKDVWLLGIGIGLLTRGTLDREPRRVRKAATSIAPGQRSTLTAVHGPSRIVASGQAVGTPASKSVMRTFGRLWGAAR